jgi:hypothetical protein
MPFTYERDDARRRVLVTVQGPFVVNEALALMEQHHAENVWTYGVLYDLRGLTSQPTNADLRQIMNQQAKGSGGLRGPVAFLAADSTVYNKACIYKVLAPSDFKIEVFRDRREAEPWLMIHTVENS